MRRAIHLIFYILFLTASGGAQQIPKDFQFWQNIEVEYNLNRRWLGSWQIQTRFNENSSRFSYYYSDAGIMYRVTKNLRLNADYIFIQKKRINETFSTRHQYNVFLNYRFKTGKFTLFDRVLTEGQFTDPRTSKNGFHLGDIYLRNKTSIRYKVIKGLSVYLSGEIYYRVDGRDFENKFNRYRLSTGLLQKLNENWLLEAYYLFENNIKSKIPNQNYIFALGISRSFYQ